MSLTLLWPLYWFQKSYLRSPLTRFHVFWFIIHSIASTIYAGSNDSMLIVHALLEVTSHPEYDIASMTFNFWHNLQICLIERYALQVPVPVFFTLNLEYNRYNPAGILMHFLELKIWLKRRETAGCIFSVHHMSRLYP